MDEKAVKYVILGDPKKMWRGRLSDSGEANPLGIHQAPTEGATRVHGGSCINSWRLGVPRVTVRVCRDAKEARGGVFVTPGEQVIHF